jgi:hypothetical protein
MSFDVGPFTPWLQADYPKLENVEFDHASAMRHLRKFLTIVIIPAYEDDGLTCELTISCIKVRSTIGFDPQDPIFE